MRRGLAVSALDDNILYLDQWWLAYDHIALALTAVPLAAVSWPVGGMNPVP
jgi:hypothetical protein